MNPFGKSTQPTSYSTNMFGSYGNNQYVSGTKDFLNSNSIVAKIAFMVLVILGFVIVLRLGTNFISWYYMPSNDPYLIKGMKDARRMSVIKQDPKQKHSIPVIRSRNKSQGLEFTYSVWILIDNLKYMQGQYRHIFHKGNDDIIFDHNKNTGLNFPNNAPGLYISPNKNSLVVIMNTFKNINEKIEIDDIPLNKWINVVIRVEGRNVDVYVNGSIKVRHKLSDVPKQNYGDIFVNMNGGYSGYLSDLHYYSNGLSVGEILKIANKGPSLKMKEENTGLKSVPPYFSLKWYFSKAN